MRTLYVSQQGCYVSLQGQMLQVQLRGELLASVQLPLLEQVLIFGHAQITTQAIRACLRHDVPIAYLSRQGYCYGRVMAIERGYRQLGRYQIELALGERLIAARQIVTNKIHNSRTILLRHQRRQDLNLSEVLEQLQELSYQASRANNLEKIRGFEGAAAAAYFSALGQCFRSDNTKSLVFQGRNRRPPRDPINALLSFGYQVLWNHLFVLVELQGLDPYFGCLHETSDRHAALVSDLIEEFRSPLVDALVLSLVNRGQIQGDRDTEYRDGGCFLNASGRKIYLQAFVKQMEEINEYEEQEKQPRWGLLMRQVRAYKKFIYSPIYGY